jgi:hypothetical protein
VVNEHAVRKGDDDAPGAGGSMKAKADARFEAALEKSGARDPRDYYRDLLKELRDRDVEGYRTAVRYYEDRLIPSVADGESDPLAEWLEYGCMLAKLIVDGNPVVIDPSGRRSSLDPPAPIDALVLHLPVSVSEPARAVGLPPTLSAAQTATYQLLVARKIG